MRRSPRLGKRRRRPAGPSQWRKKDSTRRSVIMHRRMERSPTSERCARQRIYPLPSERSARRRNGTMLSLYRHGRSVLMKSPLRRMRWREQSNSSRPWTGRSIPRRESLQQVGGAVARDRLKDAIEALELAESLERETEADYEAWRLLLEQMKEAEAAQESNLGQALAPAIADRFQALTLQRYQSIQLTPHLGTEGVVVAGAVRPPDRISVGTREQLSTLYRLCLGEYLRTAIVLDDQLVQSDDSRMEWFRELLAEKARSFQIVVFTCRPGDYLAEEAMVGGEGVVWVDSDEGFVRAIDLGRVAGRVATSRP